MWKNIANILSKQNICKKNSKYCSLWENKLVTDMTLKIRKLVIIMLLAVIQKMAPNFPKVSNIFPFKCK